LARRARFLRDYRTSHGNIPLLLVETGNELKNTEYLDDPLNRWIVTAFDQLGIHAVNTTIADLRRLLKLAELGNIPPEPRSHFVATTILAGEKAAFRLKPYAIVPVRASAADMEVRVGVLALSATAGELPPSWKTLSVDDAMMKYLPQVEKESDLIVVLARLPDDETTRLAQHFPQIDVIISGSAISKGRELPRVGDTLLVESSYGGTSLGLLALEWDETGKIIRSQNERVPIPAMIPNAPYMADLVEKAEKESLVFEREKARLNPRKVVPSIYAGAGACKQCHEKAYAIWEKSRHARAMNSLKPPDDYNRNCVQCHVTGAGVEQGFVDIFQTPKLTGVQCEACHQPAADHVRSRGTLNPGIGAMQQLHLKVRDNTCRRCHTEENSPRFEFDSYWKKIAH
jgi:hypothetical protein